MSWTANKALSVRAAHQKPGDVSPLQRYKSPLMGSRTLGFGCLASSYPCGNFITRFGSTADYMPSGAHTPVTSH